MAICPLCGASRELPEVAVIPDRGAVVIDGKVIRVTPMVARLAATLLGRSPQTLSRERLMLLLYGDDPDGGPDDSKIIDVHLVKLRRALKGTRARVVTVWGEGLYMEVTERPEQWNGTFNTDPARNPSRRDKEAVNAP